jgi:hypothetical protein
MKFIRNKITGIVYDFNPAALERDDYELCDTAESGPAPGMGIALPANETGPSVDDERKAKILEAVQSIDPANYSAPVGGRPAMPKVGDVSAITGFSVTAQEVVDALAAIPPKE